MNYVLFCDCSRCFSRFMLFDEKNLHFSIELFYEEAIKEFKIWVPRLLGRYIGVPGRTGTASLSGFISKFDTEKF